MIFNFLPTQRMQPSPGYLFVVPCFYSYLECSHFLHVTLWSHYEKPGGMESNTTLYMSKCQPADVNQNFLKVWFHAINMYGCYSEQQHWTQLHIIVNIITSHSCDFPRPLTYICSLLTRLLTCFTALSFMLVISWLSTSLFLSII